MTSIQFGFYSLTTGDYRELRELAGGVGAPYAVQWDGIDWPAPALKATYDGGAWRDGSELIAEAYDNRVVTIPLDIHGDTPREVEQAWADLGRWLTRVSAHARRKGTTTTLVPVLHVDNWGGGMSFDLYPLSGQLDPPSNSKASSVAKAPTGAMQPPDMLRDAGGGYNALGNTLTLTCRPFAYGRPIAVPATGAQVNGSIVLDVGPVPGDAPAIGRISLVDNASSGAVNRLRGVIVAQNDLPEAHTLDELQFSYPFAYPASTPGSVGTWTTNSSDPDAIGGTSIRFTPSSNAFDFTPVARVLYSSAPAVNSGLYLPLARVRDNAALGSPVIYSWGTLYGGTLTQGTTYSYVVTALNAAGETLPSTQLNVYLATTRNYRSISLLWTAVNGATSYRVYRSVNYGVSWVGYFSTSNTSFVDTGGSPTAGSPPTTATAVVAQALTQLRLKFGYLNDAADNLVSTSPANTRIGGSYELLAFNPVRVPPGRVPAGGAIPGWQCQVEARRATTIAGSIDLDELLLLPLAQTPGNANPCYFEAYYSTLANTVTGTWVVEQHRDQLVAAVLSDGSGNTLSALVAGGAVRFQPGYNRVYLTTHGINDVHDVQHSSVTVSAQVVPRWRLLPG